MLLHGGCGKAPLLLLDVAGHVDGLDGSQFVRAAGLAPGGELPYGLQVSTAGVRVADMGCEELNHPARRGRGGGEDGRDARQLVPAPGGPGSWG